MGAFKGWQSTKRERLFAKFPNLQISATTWRFGFNKALHDFDAMFAGAVVSNGDPVDFWIDQIAHIKFTAPSSAARPIWISSDSNAGNQPGVNFDTAAKLLVGDIGFGMPSSFTVLAVFRVNAIQSTFNGLLTDNISTPEGAIIGGGSGTGRNGAGIYYSGNAGMISTVNDTLSHIMVVTNQQVVIDGIQKVTGNVAPGNQMKAIAATTANTGQTPKAVIYRLIVFGQMLSDSECIKLSDNANALYAIY